MTLTEVECLCACEMAPTAQLDEQFLGPIEGAFLDTVLRDALRQPNGAGETSVPEPFISTDGPVVSTRFANVEGAWWDAYVAGGGRA